MMSATNFALILMFYRNFAAHFAINGRVGDGYVKSDGQIIFVDLQDNCNNTKRNYQNFSYQMQGFNENVV